jgi:hypothetical protein
MKFKIFLEPFIEFFLVKVNWTFKKMRFFGRFPYIRNKGFDEHYLNELEHHTIDGFNESLMPVEIVRNIQCHGYSANLSLESSLLNDISEYVSQTAFFDRKTGKGQYQLNLDNLERPGVGYLYNIHNPHINVKKLNDFANLQIKPIADAYLGADSIILNSYILATFPDDGSHYNPDFGFHYDLDDYRFLKLFIYLTDVDEESGPHQIIANSHLGNTVFRFFNRRLSDTLPLRFANNIKVMLGKKGEGFFEDTLCYHKGTRPVKPRMILQLQFALSDKSEM